MVGSTTPTAPRSSCAAPPATRQRQTAPRCRSCSAAPASPGSTLVGRRASLLSLRWSVAALGLVCATGCAARGSEPVPASGAGFEAAAAPLDPKRPTPVPSHAEAPQPAQPSPAHAPGSVEPSLPPDPALAEPEPEERLRSVKLEVEAPYDPQSPPRHKGRIAAAGQDEELARWNVGGNSDPDYVSSRSGYHPGARVVVDVDLKSGGLPKLA